MVIEQLFCGQKTQGCLADESDYGDGAGPTGAACAGRECTIRSLLDLKVYSSNHSLR